MFFSNSCNLDYCRDQLGEIQLFHTLGRAGDIFLFDSNGVHRGNRRPEGATRDAYFVEYTINPADVWGGDPSPVALADIAAGAHNPFAWMLTAPKRWSQPSSRQAPAWIETLPNINSWLSTLTPVR
jgi:hypothetical protein